MGEVIDMIKKCEFCDSDAELIFELNEKRKIDICTSCMDQMVLKVTELCENVLGPNWPEKIK